MVPGLYKNFPRSFYHETEFTKTSYPVYLRNPNRRGTARLARRHPVCQRVQQLDLLRRRRFAFIGLPDQGPVIPTAQRDFRQNPDKSSSRLPITFC